MVILAPTAECKFTEDRDGDAAEAGGGGEQEAGAEEEGHRCGAGRDRATRAAGQEGRREHQDGDARRDPSLTGPACCHPRHPRGRAQSHGDL